jgi:hypothetical protein
VLTFPEHQWGLPFEAVRRRLKRQRFEWEAKFGGPIEMAWTIEKGAAGNLHVNVLERGPSKLPQRELQRTWGGIVHIQRIKGGRGVAGYAMKEAMRVSGYSVKNAADHLGAHLELNGGRLAHWSRGYFDAPVKVVRQRLASSSEGEWEWRPEAVNECGVLETQVIRAERLVTALRNR